jgi:arylsulfatase A-like enzyme
LFIEVISLISYLKGDEIKTTSYIKVMKLMIESNLRKRSVLGILMLAFLIPFMSCSPASNKAEHPNIILFLVDDMGWQDTSVPFWTDTTDFNRLYRTPNMERLAKQGMKFTQAYATSVCSPTRISLMTGMNAARHRVTNWTLHPGKIQPMEINHKELNFPMWNVNGLSAIPGDSLAVYADPLPQVLNEAGYFTIHAGKAHLGAIGTSGDNPLDLGFDVNIAGHAAGAPGSYLGKKNFGNSPNGGNVWAVPGLEKYHGQDIFLTEAITLEAIDAIESVEDPDQPFFLYMSHYAVHSPINADDRFVQKYYDLGMDTTEARYAALVEGMDKSLGDLMDFVDKKGIADNTVILFMSDNGGVSAVIRGGEKHTHNKPLSSGKGSMHEGGIREPMLVSWPGVIKPESVTDQKLIIEDFYPSILEIAGVNDYETVQTVDGVSFVPLLKGGGKLNEDRAFIWHFPNEWGPSGPGIGAASTIRQGDWKLIYYHLDSHFELFNIEEDIGETQNLFDQNPEKAGVLAKALTSKLLEMDAQMPIRKSSGEIVPMPADAI